jgi:hypothetical protein
LEDLSFLLILQKGGQQLHFWGEDVLIPHVTSLMTTRWRVAGCGTLWQLEGGKIPNSL